MPKRVRKSPEFGRWLREARRRTGQRQEDLATRASLSQQYLSRLENQGLVPSEDELERLCRELGSPVEEARALLSKTGAAEKYASLLQDEFEAFRKWLIDLDGPLHIYILRETPEPVNPTAVEMHCKLLKERREDLYISILFRHSTPNTWLSFQALARDIGDMWLDPDFREDEELPQDEPRQRIFGYYRNPRTEEGENALPMAVPVILVKTKSAAYLYCYGSHPDVYNVYRQSGDEEYEARWKSLVLLRASSESAILFSAWIGGSHLNLELPADKWTKIRWPD